MSGAGSGTRADPLRIRAITIDLDDTLWPIGPTIERALDEALYAVMTAAVGSIVAAARVLFRKWKTTWLMTAKGLAHGNS